MMNVAFNPTQQNKQQPRFTGKPQVAKNLTEALHSAGTYTDKLLSWDYRMISLGKVYAYIDAALSEKRGFLGFLKNPKIFLNKKLIKDHNNFSYSLNELTKDKDGFNFFQKALKEAVEKGDKKRHVKLVEEFLEKIKPKAK